MEFFGIWIFVVLSVITFIGTSGPPYRDLYDDDDDD